MRSAPRNEAFFASSSSSSTPSSRSLQSALVAARQSGVLRLRGYGLSALPAHAWALSQVALPSEAKWWESRETLERLDASENSLGTVPPELGALEELVELNLSHNHIEQLPEAQVWHSLLRLADLRLSHNALRALPDGLGADGVPPLVRLHVAHNELRSLPSAIVRIRTLEELDASHNRLAALPAEVDRMDALRTLLLAHNELNQIELDAPAALVTLDVSENRLAELRVRGARALRTLQASKNRLAALALDGCDALQELYAAHNALCALPPLERHARLATADVSSNRIAGLDGERLASAPSLTRLDLSNNSLCDVGQLAPLGTMPLVTLGLQGNMLRGIPHATVAGPVSKLLAHLRARLPEGPPPLASSRPAHEPAAAGAREGNLAAALQKGGTQLVISGCGLTELPEEAFALDPQLVAETGLLAIDASHNAIVSLPAHISQFSALRQLRLGGNALIALPESLGECGALELLHVQANNLVALPPTLGRLACLIELDCSANRLTALPAELWGCRQLGVLICTGNRLTAEALGLSQSHAALELPLEHLDLGENLITTCPPLGVLSGLREIHLHKNGMRNLSSSIERCVRLQTLDLRDNEIGQLPPELARCGSLQSLSLSGNPLRSIPYHVQQKGASAVLALLAMRLA